MKLTIAILFCVIFTLQYNSVDGQIDKFLGGIHNAATKVKQDVRTFLHLNDKTKQEENKDESAIIHFVEEDSKEDTKAWQTTKQTETTAPPTTSTTTPAQNAAKNETTEEKDGRENFNAGCIAGYLRTADGRCKPTF